MCKDLSPLLFALERNRNYHRRSDGRTDRHTLNVLELCADQTCPSNLESSLYLAFEFASLKNVGLFHLVSFLCRQQWKDQKDVSMY